VFGHNLCKAQDPLPVKTGLYHAALSVMKVSFTRQEAFTE
jgi:hypothetical protein